jgi:hypothetical protein
MPKAPSSTPSPAKSEPYAKGSPSQQKTSATTSDELPEKSSPAKKGITWTDDMDKKPMIHVLSRSDINLRYDWADAVKSEFPDLSVKQVSTVWHTCTVSVFRMRYSVSPRSWCSRTDDSSKIAGTRSSKIRCFPRKSSSSVNRRRGRQKQGMRKPRLKLTDKMRDSKGRGIGETERACDHIIIYCNREFPMRSSDVFCFCCDHFDLGRARSAPAADKVALEFAVPKMCERSGS